MRTRRFDRILDDCLSRMDRGESLMEILSVYPELEIKLKPLLLAAMLGRALPQPVPGYTALRLGKNELLAEMASMQSEGAFLEPKPAAPPREKLVDRLAGPLKQLQPAYRLVMLSVVVIMAGGFFTLSASASGMADNIMHTLFFSFEQVGDLLLVRPSPPKIMGNNPIFSSDYGLPDSPSNYSGDFKGLLVGDDEKEHKDQVGEDFLTDIQTRVYSFTEKYEEVDLVIDDFDDGEVEVIDDKDLEKEEKEEEKDLEKEEKEAEKDAEKEDKEAAKDAEKAEKDAAKDEKKDEKDKDK